MAPGASRGISLQSRAKNREGAMALDGLGNEELIARFREICGKRYVITDPRSMERFC